MFRFHIGRWQCVPQPRGRDLTILAHVSSLQSKLQYTTLFCCRVHSRLIYNRHEETNVCPLLQGGFLGSSTEALAYFELLAGVSAKLYASFQKQWKAWWRSYFAIALSRCTSQELPLACVSSSATTKIHIHDFFPLWWWLLLCAGTFIFLRSDADGQHEIGTYSKKENPANSKFL